MVDDNILGPTCECGQLLSRPGLALHATAGLTEDPRFDAKLIEDLRHRHGVCTDRILAGQYWNEYCRSHVRLTRALICEWPICLFCISESPVCC